MNHKDAQQMEDENRKQVRGDMQRKLLTSISDVISVPIVFYQFSSQKIFVDFCYLLSIY